MSMIEAIRAGVGPLEGALAIEGGLIGPDQLARVFRGEAKAQAPADYGLKRGADLWREIEEAWRAAREALDETAEGASPAGAAALLGAFGFDDLEPTPDGVRADERAFPVALRTRGGRVPVVVCEAGSLDKARREPGEEGRFRSPALALQDFLNASDECLWGLATDGRRLRLMRDSLRLGRPAWLEADVGALVESGDLAGFAALWRLIHRTRFMGEEPPLEQWMREAEARGVAARDSLRGNVEEALRALAAGILSDGPTRARIQKGEPGVGELFTQLLRLVYRAIFLLTAEDRGLLHPPEAPPEAREAYALGYSFTRAARLARRRGTWDDHHDAYESAKIVMRALDKGEPLLGLPALGGLFAPGRTEIPDAARIPNKFWNKALFHLAWLIEDKTGALQRVNWRDMQTEELGSVYESLLELAPRLADSGAEIAFAAGLEAKGNARKTTGSYYTPDALVQTLLDGALDPLIAARRREGGAEGILSIRLIDPACGSGHFLLAAARRIAEAAAREREAQVTPAAYRAALREAAGRCVHGIDRNPMAVELARVALWIEAMDPGKPLGFLDANIRLGDSLLGVFDPAELERGIPDEACKPLTGDDRAICAALKRRNAVEREGQTALDLALAPAARALAGEAAALRAMPEETLEQVEARRRAFLASEASPEARRLKTAADLYVSAFLTPRERGREVPTTAHVWRALAGEAFEEALTAPARAAEALHWPLAFPDVMAAGGFDLVTGNPPWEVLQLKEEEFFALRDRRIANLAGDARKKAIALLEKESSDLFKEFSKAKRAAEGMNEFARLSGRYPLTAAGKINTYALFAELFARTINRRGRAGMIVPTGIATDATTAPFFGWLVAEKRLAQFLSFENEEFIFPAVHHAFRFSLLTISAASAADGAKSANFACMLRQAHQRHDERRRFTLTPEQIARINPNTGNAPIFRSQADAALTAKIYERVPVLIDDAKDAAGNPWKVSFAQGLFNMTSDSGLFRTAEQLEREGFRRDGTDWVGAEQEGEGKMGHRVKPDDDRNRTISEAVANSDLVMTQPPLVPAPDLIRGLDEQKRSAPQDPRGPGSKPAPDLIRGPGQDVGRGPSRPRPAFPGELFPLPLWEKAESAPEEKSQKAGGSEQAGPRLRPLYEAKMIHQFDHRWATYEGLESRDATEAEKQNAGFEPVPRYWVDGAEIEDRLLAKGWRRGWLMGWRDIARNSDVRTVIASAFPRIGDGDKILNIIHTEKSTLCAAFLANINSLTLDYVARQKLGGTSLKYFVFKQLPVLPPAAYSDKALAWIVPRVLELTYTSNAMAPFARDLGHEGGPFAWDDDRRARLRAELDGWFARAYGLSRRELMFVLDPASVLGADYPSETFRVLKNNEVKAFGEYRTMRLTLEAYDALQTRRKETGLSDVNDVLGEIEAGVI